MALDADVAEMIELLARSDVAAFSAGTVAEARHNYDTAPRPDPEPVERVEDLSVPGPNCDIPVRLYASTTDRRLPIVAFFHGGGWVLGGLASHDATARRISAVTGALVVSVDYRLAPEHPFPAPHDDCWAVTAWLAESGGRLGGDAEQLAVCGDSAGGNLAAGVALRARDEALALAGQVLIYPCIDVDPEPYESMRTNAQGYFLEADDMTWFWDHYTPDAHRASPYAVPARADDLTGLAPALVQTAEFDPLRDEGERYGERLAAAGVDTTSTRYPGVVHGFFSRWDRMERAEHAHAEVGAWLRTRFGTS